VRVEPGYAPDMSSTMLETRVNGHEHGAAGYSDLDDPPFPGVG
jgi:hypothetical protein